MTEPAAPDERKQLVGLMPRTGFNEPTAWLVLDVARCSHEKPRRCGRGSTS